MLESGNLQHGRPLTLAERKEAAKVKLKRHTERSNRWIGEDCGVHKNTVVDIREELEATGQIARLTHLIGKDGKKRPREMPKREEESRPPANPRDPRMERQSNCWSYWSQRQNCCGRKGGNGGAFGNSERRIPRGHAWQKAAIHQAPQVCVSWNGEGKRGTRRGCEKLLPRYSSFKSASSLRRF